VKIISTNSHKNSNTKQGLNEFTLVLFGVRGSVRRRHESWHHGVPFCWTPAVSQGQEFLGDHSSFDVHVAFDQALEHRALVALVRRSSGARSAPSFVKQGRDQIRFVRACMHLFTVYLQISFGFACEWLADTVLVAIQAWFRCGAVQI
jgi:hypothetical protein